MRLSITLLIGFLFSISYAQQIRILEAIPNQVVEVQDDLSNGHTISDLSWAWNSSVACFPATQREKFTGHHVLYKTELPRYSEMEVTVIPDDPSANFSLYGYEVGKGREAIVPNLPQCIRCEVDHKWDRPFKGKTQDHTRTITDLLAINNPYSVVIGVVGANGLSSGGYTLQIKLKSR